VDTDSSRLLRRIQQFKPDLLILSCGGTYDPILEPALIDWLRASRTPYRIIANMQNEHPALEEADRLRVREMLLAADRLFVVSRRNLENTRRHMQSAMPNAELVQTPFAGATDPAWPSEDPWAFACIARLEPIKGLDLLLPAFAAALGESRDWRLNIYGRGPQRDYLESCARYFGIADRVTFRGFVSRLDDIWENNHILVSAALDEGIPNTFPEAALRNRAIIGTQVGAASEWIEPGRTGFICAAPTVDLLADALREAWSQRQHWRHMGQASGIHARAYYLPNDYLKIVAAPPRG
jgi:glycosyltransferase involved in cell wall biosynthesis